MRNGLALLWALALLGGCHDGGDKASSAPEAATNSATVEDGEFSLKGPGFDVKLDLGDNLLSGANLKVDAENGILYPGSKLTALRVGVDGRPGAEMRFRSGDAPDKVIAWYRDAARKADFTLRSATRSGAGWELAGIASDGDDPFALSLNPADGGGTDGRLTVHDAE